MPRPPTGPRSPTLYRALVGLDPSPVVRLNHAVAVAFADGPAVGLAMMDGLADEGALARLPVPACRAGRPAAPARAPLRGRVGVPARPGAHGEPAGAQLPRERGSGRSSWRARLRLVRRPDPGPRGGPPRRAHPDRGAVGRIPAARVGFARRARHTRETSHPPRSQTTPPAATTHPRADLARVACRRRRRVVVGCAASTRWCRDRRGPSRGLGRDPGDDQARIRGDGRQVPLLQEPLGLHVGGARPGDDADRATRPSNRARARGSGPADHRRRRRHGQEGPPRAGSERVHPGLRCDPVPWPVDDKAYDLFMALQVFEHLTDRQREAFLEVRRIARHAIISLPIDWVMDDPRNCHHQISNERVLSWFAPIVPTADRPGDRRTSPTPDLRVRGPARLTGPRPRRPLRAGVGAPGPSWS